MAEFRWIKTSLFLILVLQFTAAATGQLYPSFTVRDGDEVTLPCNNGIDDHKNCDSTWWFFDDLRRWAVALVRDGKIDDEPKDKSDRLSVSENCSLVIKNVKDEDCGQYVCRQYRPEQQIQDVQFSQKFPLRISPSGDKTIWYLWRFIFLPVGLAALIIIVVAVNMWARIKEKKTQTDEIAVRYDAEDETEL